MKLNDKVESIMVERFGVDNVMTLATVEDGKPFARYVNAYYEDRSFYIITHELSNKMKQINKNCWDLRYIPMELF